MSKLVWNEIGKMTLEHAFGDHKLVISQGELKDITLTYKFHDLDEIQYSVNGSDVAKSLAENIKKEILTY